MMRRRHAALVAGLTGLVVAAGCSGMPTTGPVVEAEAPSEQNAPSASDIDAEPPREGATPLEIVDGFLEAMTAWPIETSVAKEYLTDGAADEWNPDAATVVYAGYPQPQEVGNEVQVELTAADRLDGSGAWRGEVPPDERSIRYRIVRQDGEFRIANPQDALLVPTSWFQQRFRQVSLYFFDPVAEILVPEPVFVPIGQQLATSLVSALLSGPPAGSEEVVRTFVPPGLSVDLSVPVSAAGVAEIDLVGDVPMPAPEAAELLLAQFAWTLRQDPDIEAFRVRIGGEEIAAPSGSTPYDVQSASQFDPAGVGAPGRLFALQRGMLLRGGFGDLEPAAGTFGKVDHDLRSFAVAPDETTAAGVVAGGTQLLTAPVQDAGEATAVVTDGTDLARPTWDYAGRLWVLDRGPEGARVLSVRGERVRQVEVPTVTGRNARRLLVSRDGTRLVAVVRTPDGDRVVTTRVVLGSRGRVRDVINPTVIRTAGTGPRVLDVVWSDVVAVSLLLPARNGGLFEVATVPANGGFLGSTVPSTIVRGSARGLAGAPDAGDRLLAELPGELVDVRTRESEGLPERTRGADYAG